jgi:hypothetical protein
MVVPQAENALGQMRDRWKECFAAPVEVSIGCALPEVADDVLQVA